MLHVLLPADDAAWRFLAAFENVQELKAWEAWNCMSQRKLGCPLRASSVAKSYIVLLVIAHVEVAFSSVLWALVLQIL